MPNSFDENGLQLLTQNEIVDNLTQEFQNIYGEDINVDSNSPDGQMINIFAQMLEDFYEMLHQIYTSFDPDQAIGVVLDQRCAINGIERKSGTYTYVDVEIVTDRSVTLTGLDGGSVENAYTISDADGNRFALASTTTLNTGTTTCSFRAVNVGAIEVLPNTIDTPVTIILGVVSVNNPGGASVEGTNEETDAELRERRKMSLSISSQGYTEGLVSRLLNIPDVQRAAVYQNRTNVTDSDGIPGHSIWVVVQGGTNEEIGKVMNEKVASGVGMKGSQSVSVEQADGYFATYYFDRPSSQTLYVKLTCTPIGGQVIDDNFIKDTVSGMTFSPNQTVDSSDIICYIKSKQDNVAFSCQVSIDNSNWQTVVEPSSKDKYFAITTSSITVIDTSEA